MSGERAIGLWVACETPAAITVHLRRATDGDVDRSGRTHEIRTLCGARSGWDVGGDPIESVRCRDCITIAAQDDTSPSGVSP